MKNHSSFPEIIDLNKWQAIQNLFSEVIGAGIRTVDKNGSLLTHPSNSPRIYEEVLSHSPDAMARCGECHLLPTESFAADGIWKNGRQCYLGFHIFSVPVFADADDIVAYVVVGPVFLGHRPELARYAKQLQELGLDIDQFADGITEIKLYTFTRIQSVVALISEVANYVMGLECGNGVPKKNISSSLECHHVKAGDIDEILTTLLEASCDIVQADLGSVMLLDGDTKELYIRASKGLKNEIVKKTRLKIGEGLAGLAVKEKRILLLDDKLKESRIRSRLKRRKIKSSIVAPLKLNDMPIGVLNVASTRSSGTLLPGKLKTLQRLIQLCETSLGKLL